MTQFIAQQNRMVHVRFQGQSWRLEAATLQLHDASSEQEVKQALARYFEVPLSALAFYVVERHTNGNLTVRPEAVFG